MQHNKPEEHKKDHAATTGGCSTGMPKTGSCGSSEVKKPEQTGSCGSGGSKKGSCG